MGTISNTIQEELKIVWRTGRSSEKKNKDGSGEIKGSRTITLSCSLFTFLQ
jgi:hypothetical protein